VHFAEVRGTAMPSAVTQVMALRRATMPAAVNDAVLLPAREEESERGRCVPRSQIMHWYGRGYSPAAVPRTLLPAHATSHVATRRVDGA